MDPNACLTRIIDAIDREDREDAIDALDDLSRWIASGGYLPARVARLFAAVAAAQPFTAAREAQP